MLRYAVLPVPVFSVIYTKGLRAPLVWTKVLAFSSHTSSVTTIYTHAVVSTNRDADVGCLVLTPTSPLGITVPAVAVTPLRLYDQPCLASIVVFLLHQLELRPIAACWTRRLHWWWCWKHGGELCDFQRQSRKCGGEW